MNIESQTIRADNQPRATQSENAVQFGASEKAVSLFHAAERHSVRVKVLKTALPVAAIAVAIAFSWFTFFATPVSTVKVQLGDGESGKLVMKSPHLNGFTKENRPYSMTAEKATQDAKNSGTIILEGIAAELPVGEKDVAAIKATSGIYDNANGRLVLDKDFTVTTNAGLHAVLQAADINIASGEFSTDKSVDIRNGDTHIVADKMQVKDQGAVVLFENNVQLVIDPSKSAGSVKP